MSYQRRKQVIQVRSGLGKQSVIQFPFFAVPNISKLAEFLFRILNHSRKNQLFLRPGHRHIQNAQFFRQIIQADFFGNHTFTQRFIRYPKLRLHIIRANSHIRVHNQRFRRILHVKAFGKPRHNRYGKLQSFAFMNTHNPDNVCIFI